MSGVAEVSSTYLAKMDSNTIPFGYKQTEVGVIPKDWVIEKLGSIGKFKNGINKSADDFGFGHPFVNLMDVFGKPEIRGNESFGLINSTEIDKKEYSLVEGDVLFIRSSVKPSGVGLTTVVMSDLKETVYSGFLIRFRTDKQLVTEFKKHCFYEESFRVRVISNSTVSANTNINQDALKDIYFVFPSSKKEQTAIANALSDVDALISELEKLIAKKQAIKTATMQQLLTGRTRLPQFALRDDGAPKGTKPSELGEIPEDWAVVTLGTASSFINGRAYSLHEWENSGTPVIRLQNLTGRGDEYYYSNLQLPEKQYCKSGDLLFMWSATFGPVIWRGPKAIYHYHIWKIACEVGYGQSYLFYLLDDMTEKLKRSSSSGGTMLHVTKEKMESTKAAFPSYEEQIAIATILSDMDAEIQALEQHLGKARQIKQGMMQELLTGRTRLI